MLFRVICFDLWLERVLYFAMRRHKLLRYDTGTMIASQPVKDAERHDFMPVKGSPAIDAGVRVFVPWALYGVVGEWHFLRRNDDPSIINGENINIGAAGYVRPDSTP